MLTNNFYIILLIAIVVFLLFTMYSNGNFEGFANRANYNVNKSIDKVLNTREKDSSFDDVLAKTINKENISNLKVVTPPQTKQVKNRNVDIFKESLQGEDDSVPMPRSSKGSGASLNNNNTFDPSLFNYVKDPVLHADDLLPVNNAENEYNKYSIETPFMDANLCADAQNRVGNDTVGSTKKNATYDLRGNVPCPKFSVSPWNNSTYEPDYNIKPLC